MKPTDFTSRNGSEFVYTHEPIPVETDFRITVSNWKSSIGCLKEGTEMNCLLSSNQEKQHNCEGTFCYLFIFISLYFYIMYVTT